MLRKMGAEQRKQEVLLVEPQRKQEVRLLVPPNEIVEEMKCDLIGVVYGRGT